MLKMFYRARGKKGFTIVELIVVIAIIGILIALILPSFNHNPKPASGKAIAKAFFYQMQDTVMAIKIAQPTNLQIMCNAEGGAVTVYAAIDNNGNVTMCSDGKTPEIGLLNYGTWPGGSVFVPMGFYKHLHTGDPDYAVCDRLEEAITKYTTNITGMQGVLTAVFDGNGVVRAAYWTEVTDNVVDWLDSGYSIISATPFAADVAKNHVFQDDNVLTSGVYCCAYPERLSRAGAKMYDYSS